MTVRVGVLGLGFMGGVHLRALAGAVRDGVDCRTVSVWDPREERRAGAGGAGPAASPPPEPPFDPAVVRIPATLDDFFADPELDLVSICTPTDTHIELCERALAAGKHVLVEKPVALAEAPIAALAARARAAGRIVIPAMCMRFWPGWRWLRDTVASGRHGALESLTLLRIGAAPSWSRDFYLDTARSGDALVDLHIHDVDLVRWILGMPVAVESAGSTRHVSTRYRFASGPALVEAEGGWLPAAVPFRMCYRATFADAVAEFESGGTPALRVHRDGWVEHPELPAGDGYDGEIRHAIRAVAGEEPPGATLEEAAEVARILAAERESLRRGGRVEV